MQIRQSLLILGLMVVSFFFAVDAWATSAEFQVGVRIEGCNNNLVCEPSFGESVATCNSDCTNFQCSDGIDNDGDGLVDYPNDPDCASLLDDKENTDGDGGGGGGSGGSLALCTISIIPPVITSGENATLIWSSSYSSLSRTILPNIGSVAPSGSVVIAPTTDTSYAGIFTGLRSTAFCGASIEVLPLEDFSGVIQFSDFSYEVTEGAGLVLLSLERKAGVKGELSVQVKTQPGSATEADYVPISETLSWLDGESGIKTVAITIREDVFDEPVEIFTASIFSDSPGVLGDPSVATISILDANTPPEEDELAYVTIIKQVVNNDTGTKKPSDFVLLLGDEQVSSGQTVTIDANQPYSLDEIGDSMYFFSSITGSSFCPSTIPGTFSLEKDDVITCVITNNDRPFVPKPGQAQLTSSAFRVSEGDSLRVSVVRADGSEGLLQVRVSSIPGTAETKSDYVPVSALLNWEDGEAGEKTFLIATTEDNLVEGDETFSLQLEASLGAVGFPRRAVVIIEDDDIPEEECAGPACFVDEVRVGIPPDSPILRIVIPVIENIETVALWYSDPTMQRAGRIVSGVGVLGGVVGLLSIGFGLQNLWWSLIRLISLLLSVVGLRRNARPWGVVYDSITKQPLDPAYVSLHDQKGKEIEGAITDLDGRYGFLVEPGTYWLQAKKTHYSFPSKRLKGQLRDELYDNLYFGEPVVISEEGEVITKNIPLDPDKFDWNEFAKRDMGVMKYYRRRDKIVARLVDGLFLFGFVATFVIFLFSPNSYNYLVLLVYVGMFLVRLIGLKRRKSGVVTSKDGTPLSFGVIRILSAKTGQEVGHSVIDHTGRYYKLIADGTYVVRIFQKVTEEHFEPVFESEPLDVTKGILNENFTVLDFKKTL